MGMNGPVDLNLVSVKYVMDMMGIVDQDEVLKKVHKAYLAILEIARLEHSIK